MIRYLALRHLSVFIERSVIACIWEAGNNCGVLWEGSPCLTLPWVVILCYVILRYVDFERCPVLIMVEIFQASMAPMGHAVTFLLAQFFS